MQLIRDIQSKKDKLIQLVSEFSLTAFFAKQIKGTGGQVSVSNLIAYQIGWGKALIRWYEAGIKGEMPVMPGDGFSTWDYVSIAQHFYDKYQYNSPKEQILVFQDVVKRILTIVEKEHETGNLERMAVWPWCTLPSGKKWPLSKWIRVNTAAPYARAVLLIKQASL